MKVYVTYATENFDSSEPEDFQRSAHFSPQGAEKWLREHYGLPQEAVFVPYEEPERVWVYEAPSGHPDLFGYQEFDVLP